MFRDPKNHIVLCGFSWPWWGEQSTWVDVLGEEKVQLQGYSCVKPKSSLGSPPCTLTALSCGERGALPNGLWGGCSACLAARLPLGDFQQSIRYFLMMPLQSTRGSHLPSVCGPPLPKRSWFICFHWCPSGGERRNSKERKCSRGRLSWEPRREGMRPERGPHKWSHFSIVLGVEKRDWFIHSLINSFLFLFHPSLLPFLPQTPSGCFLGKLLGIVDRKEMVGLLPDHGGGFHSGDLSYVTQQDSVVQCTKAGMPGPWRQAWVGQVVEEGEIGLGVKSVRAAPEDMVSP